MKIGTTELLVVLAIVVVLFGPTQIPKLAKMFGETIKNFRSGMNTEDGKADKAKSSVKEDVKEDVKEEA